VAVVIVPAVAFTLATFLVALLWRLGLALLRRPAPRYFRHTLAWHAGLFVFHVFVTVPLLLGFLIPRNVGTRPDERRYEGPIVAADGTWQLQSRESLAADHPPGSDPEPEMNPATARHAVMLTARDGVPIRAFVVPAPSTPERNGPRFVAVLVHGLFRGALEIETPGAMFRDLGAEVVLVELRNHGGSGRALATFGRDEFLDVLAAVELTREREDTRDRPLVLYGVSLGTAAAALAAPQIPDLAGLVLDAPMDDLGPAAGRMLGLIGIPQPWKGTILWSFRRLGGVPLEEVSPTRALAGLSPRVQVLLIGAGQDKRMPPDTVRALYDGLPTPPDRKELWIEPDATHGKVWVAAPEEYRERVARFCERALGARVEDEVR
jgi:dienelactone hydrolase